MSSREEQLAVLERAAVQIERRGLATLAIFTLESLRPLSFVGSQVLVVLGPVLQSLFSIKEYEVFCDAVEDRANLDWLVERLERGQAKQEAEETAQR